MLGMVVLIDGGGRGRTRSDRRAFECYGTVLLIDSGRGRTRLREMPRDSVRLGLVLVLIFLLSFFVGLFFSLQTGDCFECS